MATLARSNCTIKPSAIIPFFDVVACWFKRPASRAAIAELRQHAGHVHVANRWARFDLSYRQRIEMKQPRAAALAWLATQPVLVNSIEVAVDYAFADANERDEAYQFLNRHLVRRWHGSQQVTFFGDAAGGTRYDAKRSTPTKRSTPNSLVLYRQERSRISGAPHVLHLEWRARGKRAVQSAGIESGTDLITFDHHRFWQTRLLLYDVDAERVGRFIRNRRAGSRRRKSANYRDQRAGGVIVNSCATMQELMDRYGAWLRRLMIRISPEPFLPADTFSCSRNQPETPTQLRTPASFATKPAPVEPPFNPSPSINLEPMKSNQSCFPDSSNTPLKSSPLKREQRELP